LFETSVNSEFGDIILGFVASGMTFVQYIEVDIMTNIVRVIDDIHT